MGDTVSSNNGTSSTLFQNLNLWQKKHEVEDSRLTSSLNLNQAQYDRAMNSCENIFADVQNYYQAPEQTAQRGTEEFNTELNQFVTDIQNGTFDLVDLAESSNTYEVKEGDSLWKITREHYNNEISEEEIAKKVEQIALDNNISNPDLIEIGQQLDLSSLDNASDSEIEQKVEAFIEEYNFAQELSTDEYDSMKSDYDSAREELGLDFDFMEGKDPQNEQEYNEQLLKLAQGEIESKDIDNDGKLSPEEYKIAELQFYEDIQIMQAVEDTNGNGKFDDEEKEALTSRQEEYDEQNKEYIKSTSDYMFNIIDDVMEHSNSDNYLTDVELADYYMHLDEYQGDPDATKVRDGKINIDLAGEYPEYLINQLKEQTSKEAAGDSSEATEEEIREETNEEIREDGEDSEEV